MLDKIKTYCDELNIDALHEYISMLPTYKENHMYNIHSCKIERIEPFDITIIEIIKYFLEIKYDKFFKRRFKCDKLIKFDYLTPLLKLTENIELDENMLINFVIPLLISHRTTETINYTSNTIERIHMCLHSHLDNYNISEIRCLSDNITNVENYID